jgi:SAM-dependent methyltransferase
MSSSKGYQDDLSYIHDVGFSFFANGTAPGLLQILGSYGIHQGFVIDLGCGSGIWAAELIRAGYDVLGVDQSEAMIRIARKRAPRAKFIRASFLDVKLPDCEVVTSLGECLCYLFDEKNGPKELTKLFGRVYDALRPGGLFIFDIAQPGQIKPNDRIRNFSGPDWTILLERNEDRDRMLLTRRMTVFRQMGKLYRRSEETHRLRLCWGTDLARNLREVGFSARLIRAYGKFRLTGNRVALLAKKSHSSQ